MVSGAEWSLEVLVSRAGWSLVLLVSGVKGSLELNGLTRLLVSGAVVSEACGLRAGVKPFGDPTVQTHPAKPSANK